MANYRVAHTDCGEPRSLLINARGSNAAVLEVTRGLEKPEGARLAVQGIHGKWTGYVVGRRPGIIEHVGKVTESWANGRTRAHFARSFCDELGITESMVRYLNAHGRFPAAIALSTLLAMGAEA